MREEKRKQRELQEIEKKQAMEKIMALKKTTVGARALKNLTEQVRLLLKSQTWNPAYHGIFTASSLEAW